MRNSDNVVAVPPEQAWGTVNESEVNRLCEELNALIELEGGVNPDALSRARWASAALRSTKSGDYMTKSSSH
jgi:hypothetical protein